MARIRKGTPVKMTDGWTGRVELDAGHYVVMIRDGFKSNDMLAGYRSVDRDALTVTGTKVVAHWAPRQRSAARGTRAAPTTPVDPVDAKAAYDQAVEDAEARRLAEQWSSVTTH